MKHYELIEGDLLDAGEKYLVHQCNCVTTRPAHLAASVFDRFPWSDIYSPRQGLEVPRPDEQPGGIVVRGDGEGERFVIALLGQYYPGSPRFPGSERDGYAARRSYLISGLRRILEIPDLESVAIPWRIGCGAAGGDWDGTYEPILNYFAKAVQQKQGGIVRLYRL